MATFFSLIFKVFIWKTKIKTRNAWSDLTSQQTILLLIMFNILLWKVGKTFSQGATYQANAYRHKYKQLIFTYSWTN